MMTFISLLISLLLLVQFTCLVVGNCPNSIEISTAADECFAVVMTDGYFHYCSPYDRVHKFSAAKYDKYATMIYDHKSGLIRELSFESCGQDEKLMVTPVSEEFEVSIIWPKMNDVLTVADLDVHFLVTAPSSIKAESTNYLVCMELEVGSNQTWRYGCSDNKEANIVSFTDITPGKHILRVWPVGNPSFLDIAKVTAEFQLRVQSGNVRQSCPSVMSFEVVGSSDNGNIDSTKNEIGEYSSIPYEITNGQSLGALVAESIFRRFGFQSPELCANFQFPTALLPNVQQDSNQYRKYLEDVGNKMRNGTVETMHMLLMSARSTLRYGEAEVMLKSFLYHRKNQVEIREPNLKAQEAVTVVHIVTDSLGMEHFSNLWNRKDLFARKDIIVMLHDFQSVCAHLLKLFLDRNDLFVSFHHSGAAGYCRLAIPTYFDILYDVMERGYVPSTAAESSDIKPLSSVILEPILTPKTIICVETDQIFLSDFRDLWLYQELYFDEDDLIAAPENYMPWDKPFSAVINDALIHNQEIQVDEKATNKPVARTTGLSQNLEVRRHVNHDGTYHGNVNSRLVCHVMLREDTENLGYGLIGGIMILRLEKMRKEVWYRFLESNLQKFKELYSQTTQTSNKKWNAKLNDQDIFNAVLTLLPERLMILPCGWNVQLHARLNTFMLCLDDSQSKLEKDGRPSGPISYADQVPYNCPRSMENQVFVCSNQAHVLHFMAQTWNSYEFLRYYAHFWRMYADLSWNLLV